MFLDATHVVNWNDVQVEPEGYFLVELDCILGWREITLWNRTIGQVKVQWKHLSLEEATWELESLCGMHIQLCSMGILRTRNK